MSAAFQGPLLIVSVASGYGGAERSIEIILRHLPPELQVGIMFESHLHAAEIARLARPNTITQQVCTLSFGSFHAAVRQFLEMYRRLQPRAVLANTETSARIVAAATSCVPRLAEHSFIYVRDFMWSNVDDVLGHLLGTTILVPHSVVLQRTDYLGRLVVPSGRLQVRIVPDMVELPHVVSLPQDKTAPVLHLATVNRWKGHSHLVAAAATLRAAGYPIRIDSYGYQPDLALLRELQQQIDRAAVANDFVLRGYVSETGHLISRSICVAVTSVSRSGGPETFGRTIIEAWAHSRPVVAFATGAPRDLIRHMVDGILVPEGDVEGLAQALHRLHEDQALRCQLALAGLARARAEFAAAPVTARLLEVLAGVDTIPLKTVASVTPSPPAAPRIPRVLLDVTHTLERGWCAPTGATRLENELFVALRAVRDINLVLVRYEAGQGYRYVSGLEQAWLEGHHANGAVTRPTFGGLRWLRARLKCLSLHGGFASLVSLMRIAVPVRARPWVRAAWRFLVGVRLKPTRKSNRADGLATVDGDVLVCASPWHFLEPEAFRSWRARGRYLIPILRDSLPWHAPQLTNGGLVGHEVGNMLAVLQEADHVVAVSRYSAGYIARTRELGLDRTTPQVAIGYPSLPALFLDVSTNLEALGFSEGRPFVLYCATIKPHKNHSLLLRLWQRLAQSLPAAMLPRLVLVGRYGYGTELVRRSLEYDGLLSPHVFVLSDVPDQTLHTLYRQALFTVFPSYTEGYAMAVAESLAVGTPVLTGNHPALLEASQGLMPMLDPDDIVSWEREVRRLIQHPAALEALRVRAQQFCISREYRLGAVIVDAVRRVVRAPMTTRGD